MGSICKPSHLAQSVDKVCPKNTALHGWRRYPAFTLWELMIAMLIASLIVSLSYSVYWKFTQILTHESEQAELMHELRMLERDLYQLTESCTAITQMGDQLIFDHPESNRSLEFSDSILTIDYSDESTKEFPIAGWSTEFLNDQTEHISHFQIRCKASFQTYILTFHKVYPLLFLYSMKEP